MSGGKWRLVRPLEADGAMQMAVDEAILVARNRGLVPNTLRFFTWNPPCLSIGYFQSLEKEVDVPAASECGVDVVRRYTGGGAVFHDRELTYSLAVSERDIPADIIASYERICDALIEGLGCLQVQARFSPINDILVGGKKVSGNAQTRRSNVVLQHGTILLNVDLKKMFSLLRVPDEKMRDKMIRKVEERVTSLNEELGRKVGVEELAEALIRGFENVFNITFEESDLTDYELSLARKLREEKYATADWSYAR